MTKKIDITLDVVGETLGAYQVTDGDIFTWLPKSQVEPEKQCGPGDTVSFEVPEWLAIKKELV